MLKKAEDGDAVIIRFYETKGEETDVRIRFFARPRVIKSVNLLEQEDEEAEKNLKKKGEVVELKIKPYEIVTVRGQWVLNLEFWSFEFVSDHAQLR